MTDGFTYLTPERWSRQMIWKVPGHLGRLPDRVLSAVEQARGERNGSWALRRQDGDIERLALRHRPLSLGANCDAQCLDRSEPPYVLLGPLLLGSSPVQDHDRRYVVGTAGLKRSVVVVEGGPHALRIEVDIRLMWVRKHHRQGQTTTSKRFRQNATATVRGGDGPSGPSPRTRAFQYG